jgi:hypothetical protein
MNLEVLKRVFGSRTKALEIMYLFHGLKPVVRQGFYDNEIGRVKDFCKKHRLAVEIAPYKVVLADPHRKYSNKGFKARVDDPRRGMYFVYISKDEQKAAAANVCEMKNDHKRLGLLLGYPECCCEFFSKHEPERSRLDNDYTACTLANSKQVRHMFFTNICKRHKDITLLNHFPCSFDCEESIEIGKRYFKLLEEIDPSLAMHYAKELKARVKVGKRGIEFF